VGEDPVTDLPLDHPVVDVIPVPLAVPVLHHHAVPVLHHHAAHLVVPLDAPFLPPVRNRPSVNEAVAPSATEIATVTATVTVTVHWPGARLSGKGNAITTKPITLQQQSEKEPHVNKSIKKRPLSCLTLSLVNLGHVIDVDVRMNIDDCIFE